MISDPFLNDLSIRNLLARHNISQNVGQTESWGRGGWAKIGISGWEILGFRLDMSRNRIEIVTRNRVWTPSIRHLETTHTHTHLRSHIKYTHIYMFVYTENEKDRDREEGTEITE